MNRPPIDIRPVARARPPRRGRGIAPGLALALAGATAALGQVEPLRRVHDPAVIESEGAYYLFMTGPGVPIRKSTDLVRWEPAGRVFERNLPEWAGREVPGVRNPWAPDISRFGDEYRLYYSLSTFGSQRSSIGLAVNRTLDPADPDYAWEDRGEVIDSRPGRDPYNAIDPNVVLDEDGEPWMSFGSFHGGIYLVRLDPATGLRHPEDREARQIAWRPEPPHAVEAPFIVRKDGHFYQFLSFDFCCRGAESTYHIVVGRSRDVTGPYLDKDGKPLNEGGGSLVLAGEGSVRGPGHNAVLLRPEGALLVHHYYDADARGVPTLQVRALTWEDGWPVAGAPIGEQGVPAGEPPPGG